MLAKNRKIKELLVNKHQSDGDAVLYSVAFNEKTLNKEQLPNSTDRHQKD